MTVVPVLITSCHVSLNPNSGPVIAQTITRPTAVAKATGRPAMREVTLAIRVNFDLERDGCMLGLKHKLCHSRCVARIGLQREHRLLHCVHLDIYLCAGSGSAPRGAPSPMTHMTP